MDNNENEEQIIDELESSSTEEEALADLDQENSPIGELEELDVIPSESEVLDSIVGADTGEDLPAEVVEEEMELEFIEELPVLEQDRSDEEVDDQAIPEEQDHPEDETPAEETELEKESEDEEPGEEDPQSEEELADSEEAVPELDLAEGKFNVDEAASAEAEDEEADDEEADDEEADDKEADDKEADDEEADDEEADDEEADDEEADDEEADDEEADDEEADDGEADDEEADDEEADDEEANDEEADDEEANDEEAAPLDPGEQVSTDEIEDGTPDMEPDPSPTDQPLAAHLKDDGRAWYVVHCYSGNEDKVRHNILQRIESMSMDDLIFDVVVPTEDEVNIKDGERQTIEKKVFPGYILVNMILTEESWYMVRNTPGVTGFVGMGNDPTPLQPEEVARILKRMESDSPRVNVTFRPGERVRIVDGPFEDFYGKVSEIDMERATVRVMVNFFGRETPVELDFLQVEEA